MRGFFRLCIDKLNRNYHIALLPCIVIVIVTRYSEKCRDELNGQAEKTSLTESDRAKLRMMVIKKKTAVKGNRGFLSELHFHWRTLDVP